MASPLPKTITISRAGSSLINGTYSLDSKSKTIKYVATAAHPISNKPMILEIVCTPIPPLDTNQTFFVIQARPTHSKSPLIHYYVSKSPFTSPHSRWQCIAGIPPFPKLSIPPIQFSKMKMFLSSSTADHLGDSKQSESESKSETKLKAKSASKCSLSTLKPTKRTFLENTYLFQHSAHFVAGGRDTKHGEFVILDDTIFHPQGGGQPTDRGTIQSVNGNVVFKVDFVSNHVAYPKLVAHFGSYVDGKGSMKEFNVGDAVRMDINGSDREMFARLHSGGHLIDIGMNAVGSRLGIDFEAVKGYHFPKGAYVEYAGNVPIERRGEMKDLLQRELDDIIERNRELKIEIKQECTLDVFVKLMNRRDVLPWYLYSHQMESGQYLDEVAKIEGQQEREDHLRKMHIEKGSKVRVMSIPGFENGQCMCGGTHIDGLDRIKRITVTKFKKKNKNFRVSYQVE